MTDSQRASQILGIGLPSPSVTPALRPWIADRKVGIVVLYRSNLASETEVRKLTAEIRELAGTPSLAPIVAVDQEGGSVIRYEPAAIPGAMALGAIGSERIARISGAHVGCALRSAGITMNFAPTLDLSSAADSSDLGTRAISDDPDLVGRISTAFLNGMRSAGVLGVAKHFPGQGFATADPHLGAAEVDRSPELMRRTDLAPYAAAIESGALDGVMAAHVSYPAWAGSDGIPASLSPRLLQSLLRRELGFDGLVVTDAMHMRGIAEEGEQGELVVRAIEAGADVVLVVSPRSAHSGYVALLEAMRSGRLSRARVDASVARVLEAKRRAALPAPDCRPDPGLALDLARRAVTVAPPVPVLDLPAELFIGVSGPLADAFAEDRRILLPLKPGTNQIRLLTEQIAEMVKPDSRWIAAIQNRSQAGIIAGVVARRPSARLVLVLLGSPHDAAGIAAEARVFAYGFRAESQRAALEVLKGERCAAGRLPVSVEGVGPIGTGARCEPELSSEARGSR
ncbi:MAG TPA: glycoside hydrolase family 3 N-terminal domain-containing protein [Thermoanaerobaculia bacterium]|nr:glycoside hydrolase family 3 N-terminal domain-containing protein [Thermoanaerobaculia bacterium]